ncbi:survival protein sure-like phosphatase/nucleotidase, partial [Bombardia bombarda]
MRSSFLLAAFAAFTPAIKGLNVLITNDDGFGVANIRELYKQMTGLGHNCYIVASPSALSSTSDQTMFTTSPKLLIDGDWGLTKAGAPSLGTDPHDGHIWYYNGTPAAQVFIALDYVLPKFAGFSQPDLVISGPNFGWNLGPFVYTMTGNLGASYAAIERGIPAISFASGNNVPEPYYWVNTTTEAGLEDPSTITARLAAGLVQALADKASGSRVMPKGYGMSVNLPYITSYKDDQCTNPPFVLARMVTNITDDKAVFDSSTGLFTYG